MPNHKVNI